MKAPVPDLNTQKTFIWRNLALGRTAGLVQVDSVPESPAQTREEIIEEIIWSGFPEGHIALRNPRNLAEVICQFVDGQERPLSELQADSVAMNHLAYQMARPDERLDDDMIESYFDLGKFVVHALAMAE